MSMFTKAGIVAAALFVSTMATAAQAGTITKVYVKDGLTSPVSLSGTTQILGTASPALASTISAGVNSYSVVTSPYNKLASIHFTYASGTKACKFDTSLTVSYNMFGEVPTWTKKGTSTGSSYATCEATITAIDMTTYDYTVQFTIR